MKIFNFILKTILFIILIIVVLTISPILLIVSIYEFIKQIICICKIRKKDVYLFHKKYPDLSKLLIVIKSIKLLKKDMSFNTLSLCRNIRLSILRLYSNKYKDNTSFIYTTDIMKETFPEFNPKILLELIQKYKCKYNIDIEKLNYITNKCKHLDLYDEHIYQKYWFDYDDFESRMNTLKLYRKHFFIQSIKSLFK